MAHHRFTPTTYHRTIGSHEPVLTIESGDQVSTTTVDAGGSDATGERITEGGNPQTGPFYVKGAEPGDTLAVRLDRLTANRPFGYTADRISPLVLDPGYQPGIIGDRAYLRWAIDIANGVARPEDPELAALELPLGPHLGCFGVAPDRGQAISTATSGSHGGNMDYNKLLEGVTVYFPVFVPGALLHVGDGHALQGDGEILGTGVEISFDVTVTVSVVKQTGQKWPRAQDDQFLMAIGCARPLDQCMEHATTEMIGWLMAEFCLSERQAHILIGESVVYDLGNMFDPAYTMVCKVRRSLVERLAGR